MNDPRAKETHQDFFPEFSREPKKKERFPGLSRTQKPLLLTTNTEQLLMIGILLILVLCGIFFLGVLRGKALRQSILMPARLGQASAPRSETPAFSSQPVKTAAQQPAALASVRVQTPPPASVSEKPYTIQLVTHRKKEFAEADVSAFRKAGFTSFIIPSGEYYQVCVGQYASKEEAKKDLGRFSSKYKDCFLRRR